MSAASEPASDSACDATNYTSADNWNGLNGGSGFGPWQVTPSLNDDRGGAFVGDSNGNGGGGGPGIDCSTGRAWGMYANSGAEVTALRPFAGGLIDGQRVTIDMDNGFIDGPYAANDVVEFQLMNAAGQMRFGFHFRGGASEYQVFDASSTNFERGTGVPFTDGGLRLLFTLDGVNAYTLQIIGLANATTTTLSGALGGTADTSLDRLLLVHRNAGTGSPADAFFNNLVVSCNGQPSAPGLGSDSPRCMGQDLHLSAVGSGGSYLWTGPNDFVSSEQNPVVHAVTAADAGIYRARVTVDSCTSDESIVTVAVHATPAMPAPSNDGPVCAGGVLHLFANADADAYTWTGPNGFTSSDRNPTLVGVTPAAGGIYNLVVSVDGCTSPLGGTQADVNAGQATYPPDITIACGESTDPSHTGEATGTKACDMEPVISYADSSSPGVCPIMQVITRTWTLSYPSGSTSHGIQIITVAHTLGPTLNGVPADATVECGAVPTPPIVTADAACGLASRIPTNGLVLYYSFDDDVGQAAKDDTGRGHTGAIINAVHASNGYHGNACYFDGNGDYIRVPDSPDLHSPQFTVSAWAYSTGGSGTFGLFGKHQNSENMNSYNVYVDSGGLHGQIWGTTASGLIQTPATPLLNNWVLVTLTCDGSTMRLYVNDQMVGEKAATGYVGDTLDLLIGAGEYGFAYSFGDGTPELWWHGFIDEVRVYNVALSAADVSQLYVGDHGDVVFSEAVSGVCPKVITRTWTAEDICGYSTTATQILRVVDTQAPVLANVPADMTFECADDVPLPAYVTATDNCSVIPPPPCVETERLVGAVDTITRAWSATDDCGNRTTAVQVISITDTVPPILEGVPADVTVEPGSVPPPADVTATDPCGVAQRRAPDDGLVLSYSFDKDYGSVVPDESGHGNTGVVINAVFTPNGHRGGAYYFDGSDAFIRVLNSDWLRTTQFTISAWAMSLDEPVTVPARGLIGKHQDGQNLNSFWIFQDASGLNGQMWGLGSQGRVNTSDAPIADRWAHIAMTYDGSNEEFFVNGRLVGAQNVSYYSGNDPDLLVGGGEFASGSGAPTWPWHGFIDDVRIYNHALLSNEVEDLYEGEEDSSNAIPVQFAEITIGTRPPVIQRTWTASDQAGNSVTATQRITVIDTTLPVLEGEGADATIECPSSPVFTAPTAYDPCDPNPSLAFADSVTTGACQGSYSVTRTWVAADSCGHTSEPVSQTITVRDTTAPVLNVPSNVIIECGGITDPSVTGTATASDACDSVTVAYSDVSIDGCGNSKTIARTWTATDACGNQSTGVQTIAVVDTTPPVIACAPNQTVVAVAQPAKCAASLDLNFNNTPIRAGRTIWFTSTLKINHAGQTPATVRVSNSHIVFTANSTTYTVAVPDGVTCVSPVTNATTIFNTASNRWETTVPKSADDNHAFLTAVRFVTPVSLPGNIVATWSGDFTGDRLGVTANWKASAAVYTNFGSDYGLLGLKPVNGAKWASPYPGDDDAGTPENFRMGVVEGATSRHNLHNSCGNDESDYTGRHTTERHILPRKKDAQPSMCDGVVVFDEPTATDACGEADVECDPPSGSALSPGAHTIHATAVDECGNTSTCSFVVTVLAPIRVEIESPLSDDNIPDNMESGLSKTDTDWCADSPGTTEVINLFTPGSTVNHKVKLFDCDGNDITDTANVTVKIDVTERSGTYQNSSLVVDVPEDYSGNGNPGDVLDHTGHSYQYNLKTTGYAAGTVGNNKFFRSVISVEYKSAPGKKVGIEDVILESR